MTALVPAAGPGAPAEITDRGAAIVAAVAALRAVPRGGGRYGPRPVTELWLRSLRSDNTVKSYRLALANWDEYCDRNSLDPLTARPADVTDWLDRDRARRRWGDATVNAKVSAVSNWYSFLIKNQVAGCEHNPAPGAVRPRVDIDATETRGMDSEHVGDLLDYLERRTHNAPPHLVEVRCRDYALVWMLLATAARSGGAAHALRSQLGQQRGHRVLRFYSKGRTHVVPIEPGAGAAIDCYLAARDARPDTARGTCPCGADLSDHLFLTTRWRGHHGGRALSAEELRHLLRRHSHAAGVPDANKLVPHSLRHAAITAALDEGVSLPRVQDMAGHADPRTTRRYDHNRGHLDQSPVYDLARRWERHRHRDDPEEST